MNRSNYGKVVKQTTGRGDGIAVSVFPSSWSFSEANEAGDLQNPWLEVQGGERTLGEEHGIIYRCGPQRGQSPCTLDFRDYRCASRVPSLVWKHPSPLPVPFEDRLGIAYSEARKST